MYERKHQSLLPWPRFLLRLAAHGAVAFALMGFSLGIGVAAYVYIEGYRWDAALMNVALIVGGYGPLDPPMTTSGRLFVGVYSIYVGLVVATTIGIIVAPIAHRLLHWFHVEND